MSSPATKLAKVSSCVCQIPVLFRSFRPSFHFGAWSGRITAATMIISNKICGGCAVCYMLTGVLKRTMNHTVWQGRDNAKVLDIRCDPTTDRDVNGRH
jgi:hypothetical protein